ncbi:MAG: hypothetical protein ABGY43_04115 [bacterium]
MVRPNNNLVGLIYIRATGGGATRFSKLIGLLLDGFVMMIFVKEVQATRPDI